jgi:hypothetical protein
MGNRISSILYRHGNEEFATGHNSNEGGSGIYKVRGEIVHWAEAIGSAVDRGKKQGWEK